MSKRYLFIEARGKSKQVMREMEYKYGYYWDIIDEANRLFGSNWCKYRRKISWERLINEIDKAKMGKKTRFPFKLKDNE